MLPARFVLISRASSVLVSFFFFFNDTATTEIYTLSLHDALPICTISFTTNRTIATSASIHRWPMIGSRRRAGCILSWMRSEEHTSELQSQSNLVCRLLLEKKKREKCTSLDATSMSIAGNTVLT